MTATAMRPMKPRYAVLLAVLFAMLLEHAQTEACGTSESKCCNELCVPRNYIGDGEDDCGDGSDETNPAFQCSISTRTVASKTTSDVDVTVGCKKIRVSGIDLSTYSRLNQDYVLEGFAGTCFVDRPTLRV